MFIKFIRKYGIGALFAFLLLFTFFVGFFVGRLNRKEVPVFIEKEIPVIIENNEEGTYKEIELTATAYCPCEKCCGKWGKDRPIDEAGNPIVYTASGTIACAGRTIAVDPSVIPYGTEVIIDGHTYIADDCGGGIKGNRIDIYFDSHQDAINFGRKKVVAKIVGGSCGYEQN